MIAGIVSNGYSSKHTPRPTRKERVVASIYKHDTDAFRSLENIYVIHDNHFIYYPPLSAKPGLITINIVFFEEWNGFIDQHAIRTGPLIIMGDLNIHINNATSPLHRQTSTTTLSYCKLPASSQSWKYIPYLHVRS